MNYTRKAIQDIISSDRSCSYSMLRLGPCVSEPVSARGSLGVYRLGTRSWVNFRIDTGMYVGRYGNDAPLLPNHPWGPL